MRTRHKSITLLELLISLVLLSLIVLGFGGIEIFSRFHVTTAGRRTQIQNEVSYILDHMSKQITRAIGNERVFTDDTVVNTANIAGDTAIRFYIDGDGDGQRDTPVAGAGAPDFWIAYRFTGNAGLPANRYQIWYCPQSTGAPPLNPNACGPGGPSWPAISNKEILGRRITVFARTKPGDPNELSENWAEIALTACWNPNPIGAPYACGTPDNPTVTMTTRIKMPSVSTN